MDTLSKKEVRRHLRGVRDGIPESVRSDADRVICRKVMDIIRERGFDTVLAYISVGSETGTAMIISAALELGLKTGVPLCDKASHTMTFHRLNSPEDVRPGAYGIPEPAVDSPISDFGSAICIVPGLGFTADGQRIGYGGGYYDRFLAAADVFAVGICYSGQICGSLPLDKYDRKMNLIVTEGDLNG